MLILLPDIFQVNVNSGEDTFTFFVLEAKDVTNKRHIYIGMYVYVNILVNVKRNVK